MTDILDAVALAAQTSRTQARRLVEQGAVWLDGQRMTDLSRDWILADRESLDGTTIYYGQIRIGKRRGVIFAAMGDTPVSDPSEPRSP